MTKTLFSSAAFSENMKHHKFARRRHFPVKDAWSGSTNMQVKYYIFKVLHQHHHTFLVYSQLTTNQWRRFFSSTCEIDAICGFTLVCLK